MSDPRMQNLAKILVAYSVSVKPGDWVLINGHPAAMPLVTAVQREVLRAGGLPNVLIGSEQLNAVFYQEASDEQLQWISPIEKMVHEQIDVVISLEASENTRALSSINPDRIRMHRQGRRDLFQLFMQRAGEGKLRWVLTQYPCQAYAQDADMSLEEYEAFVYGATFADQPDPLASWQKIHDEQQRLVDWLKGKDRVEVRGPNSDLSLSIAGRTFINSDGKHNMPSGEIFTGPVEDSANGWIRFTYPAITGGREVEGVELHFENGRVVKASASKNEDFLLSMIESDEGSHYLGEFAVGTNYGIQRFTKSILFDEKIGGSIHLALGAGYPETGSRNQSSLHWDFICDMQDDSQILVDGELFYKNGKFMV